MGTSPTKMRPNRANWLIPLVIFVVALLVRIVGLDFGFPLLLHHDEQYIINSLVTMSQNHTLDSGLYNRPNQMLFTILFGYLNLLSKLLFNTNMGWVYEKYPLFFYYQARLVVAIFGSLVPVLAWYIGKAIKGFNFSLPAAFFTCFYPSFIQHSHYITPDILNTFFTLGVLLFCLIFLSNKRIIWLIIACMFVAMNTLEKYPGILSFGIILFTVIIEAFVHKTEDGHTGWGLLLRRLVLSFSVVVLTMLVIAPHLFMKLPEIREILIVESVPTHLGADNLGWGGNLLFYVGEFIQQGGWLTAILVIVGIIFSLNSKRPEMVLLFYGFGYWLALSKLNLHWERWSPPMMISPLLLASFGTAQLWKKLPSVKFFRGITTACIAILALIYAINGFTTSVVLTWPDTRNTSLDYLADNTITPENSISEGFSPLLPRYFKVIFDFDFENPGNVKYVILSSETYGYYEAEPERYALKNAYYARLRESATLIKEFVPDKKPLKAIDQAIVVLDYFQTLLSRTESNYRFGPTIQIYRLSP